VDYTYPENQLTEVSEIYVVANLLLIILYSVLIISRTYQNLKLLCAFFV
jgi:hypothetical protein